MGGRILAAELLGHIIKPARLWILVHNWSSYFDALEFEFDVLGQDVFGELAPQPRVRLSPINLASALARGVASSTCMRACPSHLSARAKATW
jgi:hypothetical protein